MDSCGESREGIVLVGEVTDFAVGIDGLWCVALGGIEIKCSDAPTLIIDKTDTDR